MLVKVALLAIFSGLTVFLSHPTNHPGIKSVLCLGLFCAITMPVFSDYRLCLVPVLIAGMVVLLKVRYIALVPLCASVVPTLMILLTPHADDQLYLATRYFDTFTYIAGTEYFSHRLQDTVTVDRLEGDTYQSALYNKIIASRVAAQLPPWATAKAVEVNRVQTTKLYFSIDEYMSDVKPVIHLSVFVEEGHTLTADDLPDNTIWEVLQS